MIECLSLFTLADYRFNQPLMIHSSNTSLALQFRMDPNSGTEQFFEGAFAIHSGNPIYNEHDKETHLLDNLLIHHHRHNHLVKDMYLTFINL